MKKNDPFAGVFEKNKRRIGICPDPEEEAEEAAEAAEDLAEEAASEEEAVAALEAPAASEDREASAPLITITTTVADGFSDPAFMAEEADAWAA